LELTRAFFERDLSVEEADRLGAELLSDPRAAEALLALAQDHYRACGLPEPSWAGRPKRGLPRGAYWFAGLVMAAGLSAYFFSDERTPAVPVAPEPAAEADREVPLPPPTVEARARPSQAQATAHPSPAPAAAAPAPSGPAPASADRQGRKLQILLNLAEAGPAEVTVVDDAGHVRGTVFKGSLPAGEHPLPWDGLDPSGHAVPAGQYQVVVLSQGRRMVQTLRIKR
jgi:hypothetical protein